jgi:hypothetical protein
VAIDASSHHASVTNARAERIKKHYAAKWCKPSSTFIFGLATFGFCVCSYKMMSIIFAVWRSDNSPYLGPSPVMFFLVRH